PGTAMYRGCLLYFSRFPLRRCAPLTRSITHSRGKYAVCTWDDSVFVDTDNAAENVVAEALRGGCGMRRR
ncbi:unnamed protein product, partial [Mycena citricolor]